MTQSKTVQIEYFSDVLCIWAYFAQLRIDAITANYGESVHFAHRFCSVFGDTPRKMATTWASKGGYDGFNAHLRHVAEGFPEVRLCPDLWLSVRPPSSMGTHAFLKAVQIAEADGECPVGAFERTTTAMRCAFFEQGRDIANWDVQADVATGAGVDLAPVERAYRDGRAFAALSSDYQDAVSMGIQGSPTFVFNEGRQKLYGNVGYRIIDANIQELLRAPAPDQASWC